MCLTLIAPLRGQAPSAALSGPSRSRVCQSRASRGGFTGPFPPLLRVGLSLSKNHMWTICWWWPCTQTWGAGLPQGCPAEAAAPRPGTPLQGREGRKPQPWSVPLGGDCQVTAPRKSPARAVGPRPEGCRPGKAGAGPWRGARGLGMEALSAGTSADQSS